MVKRMKTSNVFVKKIVFLETLERYVKLTKKRKLNLLHEVSRTHDTFVTY